MHIHKNGACTFIIFDSGLVLPTPNKIPSLDPQLALQWVRLVFDRTLAANEGHAMAQFIAHQHLFGHYTGKTKSHRLARKALYKLQRLVDSW